MCLPSDALLQHLPSYLGFSYLGCGVSLQNGSGNPCHSGDSLSCLGSLNLFLFCLNQPEAVSVAVAENFPDSHDAGAGGPRGAIPH